MDLVQIRIFAAAAKSLNFTKVAEEMFISQPSISKHISALEDELGDKLFVRTSRSVALTDFGLAFFPYATALLEKEQDIFEFLRTYKHGGGNKLVLGIASVFADSVNVALYNSLVSSTQALKELYPDLLVRLRFCPRGEIPLLIDQGKLDCGLVPLSASEIDEVLIERHGARLLQKTEFYLAVPPRNVAAGSLGDTAKGLDTLYFVSEGLSRPVVDRLVRQFHMTAYLHSCSVLNDVLLKVISDEGAGVVEGQMLPFLQYCGIATFSLDEIGADHGLYLLKRRKFGSSPGLRRPEGYDEHIAALGEALVSRLQAEQEHRLSFIKDKRLF